MFQAIRQLTPVQATVWLIVASSVLRLCTAGTIGLSVDEAHYALYGLHLDWSYFDHPPMVGWLQALALPFGTSELVLRIPAILLFALSSGVLFRLCIVLFPQDSAWLGFVSVALLHSAAMLQLIGLALLPEAPLLLFSLLSVLALHAVLTSNGLKPWLWLGLCLGLAGLSKYTAITLVATVSLGLLVNEQWRRLREAGPWLACVIGVLVIMPVLYWNAQHDWMSFSYQLHHGARNPDWEWGRFVRSQLAQILVYGPLLIVFGVIALVAAWGERRHPGVVLCAATALPVLLLFGIGAGREMTLPHWTALAWVALIPLVARWIMRRWQRSWVRLAVWFSASYAGVFLMMMFVVFSAPWLLPQNKEHPLADLYGWEHAAQQAERLRREMAADGASEPVLFVGNWTQGSRLAWYARPAPVQVLDARQDQFDLWYGSPQHGARGVLVLWPDVSPAETDALSRHFGRCIEAGSLPVEVKGRRMSTFTYLKCEGWHA